MAVVNNPRVLCIVLSGGQGSRLGPLTTGRAKASLPVGGHHRLIDVSMSNAAHSDITGVWVLEQYEPHLLNEHLAGGRPWDLDRTRGGFRTLPPFEGHDRDAWSSGNADALARNSRSSRRSNPTSYSWSAPTTCSSSTCDQWCRRTSKPAPTSRS